MQKYRLKIGLAVTITLVLYMLSSLPAYALSPGITQKTSHEVVLSSKPQETRPQCQHLIVHLHGNSNPTWKCDDPSSQPSKITPATYTTDCSNSTLELGNSYPLGDWTICFLGAGSTNMTTYCPPLYAGGCAAGSWNDQADYYLDGCSGVWFYADINEGGSSQYDAPHNTHYFNGTKDQAGYYTLSDNTLSSLTLLSSCTSG